MSTTTPQPLPQTQALQNAQIMHNLALGALIICPLLIAIPPRKLDIYTYALIGGTAFGANQILKERTGYGVWQRMEAIAAPGLDGVVDPERAREMQRQIREAGMRKVSGSMISSGGNSAIEGKEGGVVAELKRLEEERKAEEQKPDWKKERDRKEKEYLEEGKGYADLIMDQVWEVWNGGKEKVERIKEVDEKVVEERKADSGKK